MESEVNIPAVCRQNLSVVSQSMSRYLHNFERFVDLPQNRNFLTLFRFDAHLFPFTKERYVLIPPGSNRKRKERGTRTITTRNAAFSISTRFTRVAVARRGKRRGMQFLTLRLALV